ncbi:hypothetical protein [Streptomyces rubradiris]|uniref:Uncharacterized protein n=1 Tax=Streptomyces rubradiris TaxID=285531 RepID=A0ABQ3RDD5_STRRR|nr:hypothetical protein [Streptomyces rubradiris]GHG95325.1 hypothetical protein GCM10018792_06030 [Streptomyces rubradiris]GHI53866.1 hypothetical protein Srubr_37120 [Streptomyces rubradiris]
MLFDEDFMELTAKVTCRECARVVEITVRSAEAAEKKLKSAGWVSAKVGGDRDLCPECSKPAEHPSRPSWEAKPENTTWGPAEIAPLLLEGGFAHEPGADAWKNGPDFCWIEAMRKDEWIEGADLCVRVHYALGPAKRRRRASQTP